MTPIGDVLQVEHIILSISAMEKGAAIDEVLAKLNGDMRVKDFPELYKAVHERDAAAIAENGCGICVAHGRTEAVSSLVMAVGRSAQGIAFPGLEEPVRLVFVAGIPRAFNSEYLRIVGAIARICRDKHQLDRLLATKTTEEFLHILEVGEIRL
jgi:mannitol/fructose-specific phosphotransferase system IIA component (Ntr-type)